VSGDTYSSIQFTCTLSSSYGGSLYSWGKSPRYPFNFKIGEPQGRSGYLGRNLLHLSGMEPQILGCPVRKIDTKPMALSGFLDVCKSVHHHTIQINQTTRCNSFTSLLLDVHMWFNMFRASSRPSSGAYNCINSLWFYPLERGGSSVVGRDLADHDQQRSIRFLLTVEPEAPSAVVCSWW